MLRMNFRRTYTLVSGGLKITDGYFRQQRAAIGHRDHTTSNNEKVSRLSCLVCAYRRYMVTILESTREATATIS